MKLRKQLNSTRTRNKRREKKENTGVIVDVFCPYSVGEGTLLWATPCLGPCRFFI